MTRTSTLVNVRFHLRTRGPNPSNFLLFLRVLVYPSNVFLHPCFLTLAVFRTSRNGTRSDPVYPVSETVYEGRETLPGQGRPG